jgi:serine/threonine protein kinase
MLCCLNPDCDLPINPDDRDQCQNCNTPLVTLLYNRFKVVEPIGRGGFGKTYLAEDTHKLNEQCVVKQLVYQTQGSMALQQKVIQLFEQEARSLQQLGDNPQIPTLMAYFEENGYLYLAQQFIEGDNLLNQLEKERAFSEEQIHQLLLDLLPILQFIHDRGMIHRDIKPGNIMCRRKDNKLVLIDFGVSKLLSQTVVGESVGTSLGSHGYSPPEQIKEGKAVYASDLFALGATCFHLMSGIHPFHLWTDYGYSWITDWRKHISNPITEQLGTILDKLLQKDVQNRYQSAAEVLQELQTKPSIPPTILSSTFPASPDIPPASPDTSIIPSQPSIETVLPNPKYHQESKVKPNLTSIGSGRLLGGLGLLIYAIFVLLPASSTQAITWPWVIIWQTGLFCMALVALLKLWRRQPPFWLLGHKLDWAIALLFISLCLSTIFAQFPAQATWNSCIGFALIAAIYATHNYLHQTGSLNWLLTFQGGLSLVFIVESLILWIVNTLVPNLSQLNQLRPLGINLNFDFSDIQSRNWAPIGHQNYVAGFLMLAIPLLIGLAIAQPRRRTIWSIGVGLGCVNLYTTSSRGGFLGISVLLAVGILVLLTRSKARLQVLLGGMGAIAVIAVLIAFNNRLQSLVSGLLSGRGGSELLYRIIAAYTGGHIGLNNIAFGAGPGSAALFYQRYRPDWAGREAEMMFQLHSTPVQIWAELGSLGCLAAAIAILALLGLFVRLYFSSTWRSDRSQQIITYALFGGLLAYTVQAITDYQLDVFAISGSLVIFIASVAYIGQIYGEPKERVILDYPQPRRWLAGTMTAFFVAAIAWMLPVNVAWHFSSVGFNFLSDIEFDTKTGNIARAQDDLQKFKQNLQRSHELASWESYYPYQLGWNLGNLSTLYPDPEVRDQLKREGLEWLQKGIKANPYQEFGYNSAAWLSLSNRNPIGAEKFFRNALELVPAKRGLFYGLGMSLLAQGKNTGTDAIAREWLNDPIFITSPTWNLDAFQGNISKDTVSKSVNKLPSDSADLRDRSIAYQSVQKLDALYKQLLATTPQQSVLFAQLQHTHAVVDWWLGRPDAIERMRKVGNPLAQTLADALDSKQSNIQAAIDRPTTPAEMAIAAWFKRDRRSDLLKQAWAMANRRLPSQEELVIVNAMIARMDRSKSLDEWLRQPLLSNDPLVLRFRRERTGFGVLSRHDDSPIPVVDYLQVESNAIISTFFADLFPTQGTLALSGI